MAALHGRRALVTGAASGIGRAITEAFVAEGASVIATDRDASGLAGLAGSLPGVRTATLDVTDEAAVATVVDRAARDLGGLDVVVCSHGILTQAPIVEMSLATWEETLRVDLTGVFLVLREAARLMAAAGGGRIITVASQLAIKGGVEVAHYAAAKAGVLALTKSAALEWAPHGILVNAIAPGPVVTPLTDAMTESWKAAKSAELPLGRFGRPHEVAPTAVLLASTPGGDLYTGQTLGPNCGDVMP